MRRNLVRRRALHFLPPPPHACEAHGAFCRRHSDAACPPLSSASAVGTPFLSPAPRCRSLPFGDGGWRGGSRPGPPRLVLPLRRAAGGQPQPARRGARGDGVPPAHLWLRARPGGGHPPEAVRGRAGACCALVGLASPCPALPCRAVAWLFVPPCVAAALFLSSRLSRSDPLGPSLLPFPYPSSYPYPSLPLPLHIPGPRP